MWTVCDRRYLRCYVAAWAVARKKRLNGIRTHDLCVTGANVLPLSYEATGSSIYGYSKPGWEGGLSYKSDGDDRRKLWKEPFNKKYLPEIRLLKKICARSEPSRCLGRERGSDSANFARKLLQELDLRLKGTRISFCDKPWVKELMNEFVNVFACRVLSYYNS